MKKVLALIIVVFVFGFGLLISNARAHLLGPYQPPDMEDVDLTNDNAAGMSAILGTDVWLLDKWDPKEGPSGLLAGQALTVGPDPSKPEDDRYAAVSWDLTDTGYFAWAIAVKDGNTPEGTGYQWIYYLVTGDQSLFGSGVVDTLFNGAGGISHISLYGNDTTTTTPPVPEPATLLLLGSGLIGLAGIGRKRFLKK